MTKNNLKEFLSKLQNPELKEKEMNRGFNQQVPKKENSVLLINNNANSKIN